MKRLIAITAILLSGTSVAETIHVPGDYETIQAALNASSNGDTISIAEGTYLESAITLHKDVSIIGTSNTDDGTPTVTIDAQFNDVVFYCESNSTFENLVITGGSPHQTLTNGGGMYILTATVGLTNCTITNNSAKNGGGIFNDNSTLTLTNCTVSNNGAVYFQKVDTGQGGGISNSANSTVTLINTTISGNSATWGGGICNQGYSLSTLDGCTVSNNIGKISGGGIYSVMSSATLKDTTLCANWPTHLIGAWVDLGGNSFSDECDLGEPAFCAGDVNEDYDVNVLDLLYVIAVYNTDNPTGDLNADGWVDVADLLYLIGAWGECP